MTLVDEANNGSVTIADVAGHDDYVEVFATITDGPGSTVDATCTFCFDKPEGKGKCSDRRLRRHRGTKGRNSARSEGDRRRLKGSKKDPKSKKFTCPIDWDAPTSVAFCPVED